MAVCVLRPGLMQSKVTLRHEVSHKLPIHGQFWQEPTDVTHVIESLRHCFRVVTAQLPIYAANHRMVSWSFDYGIL